MLKVVVKLRGVRLMWVVWVVDGVMRMVVDR